MFVGLVEAAEAKKKATEEAASAAAEKREAQAQAKKDAEEKRRIAAEGELLPDKALTESCVECIL